MKLSIELVPSSCWYSNLRNKVGRLVWDGIRKKAYKEAGYKCGICGMGNVVLYCHEVWQYDDVKHVQKLLRFVALCELCHMVKHIGFASIRANDGKFNFDNLIKHFMRVNKCSLADYKEYVKWAFYEWGKRSNYEWKCELGEYEKYLNKLCEPLLVYPVKVSK